MKRILFLIGGWLSLLLGVIGAFLPILPTTPFVLLAAYCFSKGSTQMHQWLLNQRTFGPMIRDWEADRVIRPRAKWFASIAMIIMISYPLIFKALPIFVKATILIVCVSVLVFIWSCPSAPRAKVAESMGKS